MSTDIISGDLKQNTVSKGLESKCIYMNMLVQLVSLETQISRSSLYNQPLSSSSPLLESQTSVWNNLQMPLATK